MADLIEKQFGNYRLLQLLGRGGFAEVYLAEHLTLATKAAVKILHAHLATADAEHFQQEARIIANLIHPHIIRVFDFAVQDGTPYLVMDYAPGGTLRQRHPKGSLLPPATILSHIKQAGEALQYAHDQRLIHRDIKPENMLVGRNNEVLLSDFGIATFAQTTSDLKTQGFAGTASYAAPEQLRGKPVQASDQYALAVVVYEWLSGDTPFHGSPLEVATQQVLSPPPLLREKLPGIAPILEQVVMTALSKEPKDRFGSVRAFVNALEQAFQATPTTFSTSGAPMAPNAAQPEQAGAGSIYSAPTQLTPPSPSVQPGHLPTTQIQGALQAGTIPAPPGAPESWASGIPPTVPAGKSASNTASNSSPSDGSLTLPFEAGKSGTPPTSPPLAPLPTRQQRRKRGRMALFSILSALLIVFVIGGGILVYTSMMQGQAPTSGDTSGTATANAQGTAEANVLATATTQAQATVGVLQTATTGTPRYSDLLTAGNVDDTTWTNDGASCFFAANGYHVHVAAPSQGNAGQLCKESDKAFQNVTITVQMVLQRGYSGGLVFRLSNNQGYFFEVGVAGNYQLRKWGAPDILQVWTNSPAIHRGLLSQNILQVIVHGNELLFYVNSMFLTLVQDAAYATGDVGFVSETDTTGPGEAVFSNLNVYASN